MDDEPLLAPNFLFRFSIALQQAKWKWTKNGASPKLAKKHVLPCLRAMEGRNTFAEVRGGWSEQGVLLQFQIRDKQQPVWRRTSRLSESDGVQVWLSTRDTHNIHRAGRFCHRFVFVPGVASSGEEEPLAATMPIGRAREMPPEPPAGSLQVSSSLQADGYTLQAFISTKALVGYDPSEHTRLAFAYAVIDRELGWQTLALGPEFPFAEDPSLWCAVDLAE